MCLANYGRACMLLSHDPLPFIRLIVSQNQAVWARAFGTDWVKSSVDVTSCTIHVQTNYLYSFWRHYSSEYEYTIRSTILHQSKYEASIWYIPTLDYTVEESLCSSVSNSGEAMLKATFGAATKLSSKIFLHGACLTYTAVVIMMLVSEFVCTHLWQKLNRWIESVGVRKNLKQVNTGVAYYIYIASYLNWQCVYGCPSEVWADVFSDDGYF